MARRGREEALVSQGEADALDRVSLGSPPLELEFDRLEEQQAAGPLSLIGEANGLDNNVVFPPITSAGFFDASI